MKHADATLGESVRALLDDPTLTDDERVVKLCLKGWAGNMLALLAASTASEKRESTPLAFCPACEKEWNGLAHPLEDAAWRAAKLWGDEQMHVATTDRPLSHTEEVHNDAILMAHALLAWRAPVSAIGIPSNSQAGGKPGDKKWRSKVESLQWDYDHSAHYVLAYDMAKALDEATASATALLEENETWRREALEWKAKFDEIRATTVPPMNGCTAPGTTVMLTVGTRDTGWYCHGCGASHNEPACKYRRGDVAFDPQLNGRGEYVPGGPR